MAALITYSFQEEHKDNIVKEVSKFFEITG